MRNSAIVLEINVGLIKSTLHKRRHCIYTSYLVMGRNLQSQYFESRLQISIDFKPRVTLNDVQPTSEATVTPYECLWIVLLLPYSTLSGFKTLK